ncbi:MAG: hypothetical protein RIQ49_1524 [Pseudomonadota bacterium]
MTSGRIDMTSGRIDVTSGRLDMTFVKEIEWYRSKI